MKVALLKEQSAGERRVAVVPAGVTALRKIGHELQLEKGAGVAAGYSDSQYAEQGATVSGARDQLLAWADLVVQVRGHGTLAAGDSSAIDHLRSGQLVIALQDPLGKPERIAELAERGVGVLALETIPRISRAQRMDVLSSMATIAGYRAVLLAAYHLPQMFPMLMTAAGTLSAARVLVIGAGVAGLQAIATARRLGGVVRGYDIRPAAVEQIQSLGAKAVEIPVVADEAEGEGGYARAQGEEFNRKQQELLAEVVSNCDVAITTAAIPGARSPLLITQSAVEGMRPGSVIVDLAAERGGNCELSQPDQNIDHGGVLILGPTDLASQAARHASQMFSKNVTTLIEHLTQDGQIALDLADEITDGLVVAQGGVVRHPAIRAKLDLEPLPQPSAEPETAEA